ncbi:MAG: PASTA domain-containing protein, partial [Candidatus Latescibacteria bacterium]|nr:PASTA domain-containing protein [Candidatus Latescibacterota bacterium]
EVTVGEAFVQSSNIGAVKLAAMIGKEKMYRRARSFGFGTVTGIDVPEETGGDLPNPKRWSKLTLPTLSFGQGVAVSPIQLAMAYAAVAGGGELFRPRIVREVVGDGKRRGRKFRAVKIRRVMKASTAARMEELLCRVVESGTGASAALPNVRIAGKTGTAQRISRKGKGYEQGKYVSSFVGYIVDREPRILCLVMVDSPKGLYYGSQVAAPVFKNIVNRILNMGNSPLTPLAARTAQPAGKKIARVPDLREKSVSDAVAALDDCGLAPVVVGDSTTVAKLLPPPGTLLAEGSAVTLYSNPMTVESGNRIRVPNLRGKTVRQAMQDLVQAQLEVTVSGSGIVMSQKPSAGSLVEYGTVCRIVCGKN